MIYTHEPLYLRCSGRCHPSLTNFSATNDHWNTSYLGIYGYWHFRQIYYYIEFIWIIQNFNQIWKYYRQKLEFDPFRELYGMPMGFPGGGSGKEPICQCRRHKRRGFDSWIGKIPCRRAQQPTPVFLPEESHWQRSLAGYSSWGYNESDRTEATWHTHTHGMSIKIAWVLF